MSRALPRLGAGLALALLALSFAPPRAAAAPTFDVRSFGARGDGKADDSEALQRALDAAREAGGGVVHLPAGTYLVAPPAARPGSPRPSIRIGSNVWLRGDGPATVLKVKDGVGTYRALLSNHPTAASEVENVTISDLRVDQNCARSGGDVRVDPAGDHLFAVYLAWGGRRITVERVHFDPVCGVHAVQLNAPRAKDLAVRDSAFRFVKGPTSDGSGFYDNTAVYVHGAGSTVTGNVFEARPADGARGAIELHGALGIAAGNLTRGYQSCVRVVGTSGADEPSPARSGFTVSGNTCAGAKDAINVWSVTGHPVRDVIISGNTIGLAQGDHLAHAKDLRYFSGISFVWDAVSGHLEGDVENVLVEGNTITAQRASGAWRAGDANAGGIVLTPAGSLRNVTVRGNVVRDVPTTGIRVQAMRRGSEAAGVRIEGNVVVDAGHDPAAGEDRAGIWVAGRLRDVAVAHNTVIAPSVPFRGRYAIRATAAPGSARVGVHDNVWSSADPAAGYEVALEGEGVDAGPAARIAELKVAPARGQVIALDPAARTWDVTVTGPAPFTIRAPPPPGRGTRLLVRVRNGGAGPLGAVRWDGFKLGPWTAPRPGYGRAVEVLWDGRTWVEVASSQEVPN